MFDYPSMDTHSAKGMRFYETPAGNFYPSITTILGQTMPAEKAESLKAWQNSLGIEKAEQVTREAAAHGTAVHLLAERYLNGDTLVNEGETFDERNLSAFSALKMKLNKVEEVWAQEVALYSDEIAVAGRTDLIGVYKGKPSIIDFKTSTRLKGSKDIEDYRLQLCAYAIMHNEMFGTNIQDGVVLMTSGSGFPQEFLVNLNDHVAPLKARVNQFYSKVEV